ncbi:MAG: hypothetical protein NT059_08335 [Planctomycetota bacterium]|nr:hypothetical protein [Planctomycetota bacterium]
MRQFTASAFIAILALSACLLGTSSMPGCSSPSQRQLELDRQYTEQTRFRVQLTSELLDIADTAASLFQAEVIRARLNGRPEREIAYLELTRNNAAANYRSLALGQDAWGALVDLYVFSELSNAACEHRADARPDLATIDCDATYGEIHRRILAIASKPDHITAENRAILDAAVEAYKTKHPDLISAGMMRLEDLAEYSGTASAVFDAAEPGMMSSITNAATELEQTRLLGAHVIWLASRLPTAAGWEAQATIDMAISDPGVQSGLERATLLSKQLDATSTTVATLSANASGLATDVRNLSASVGELRHELGNLDGDRALLREVIVAMAVIAALFLLVLGGGFFAITRAVRTRQATDHAPGERESA